MLLLQRTKVFFLLLVVTLLSNVPVRMPTHMSMQMSMHRAVEHVYLHMSTHICMLIHMSIRGISSTARSTSKQQHGDEESDTSNMHASYNMHGACLTAYSVVRHATCNMQHATCTKNPPLNKLARKTHHACSMQPACNTHIHATM